MAATLAWFVAREKQLQREGSYDAAAQAALEAEVEAYAAKTYAEAYSAESLAAMEKSQWEAKAAREGDPAETRSILTSAEASRDAQATIASLQASIERAKAQIQESRRPKEVPWWAAVAIILGVIVALLFIGLAPRA